MRRVIRLSSLMAIFLFCSHSQGNSIEAVSGPQKYSTTPMVQRYSVHLAGEEVHYGQCDAIESKCLPNSDTYTLKRKLGYDQYQDYLAKLFDIEPRFLKNDEKTKKNFDALVETLTQIMEAGNTPEESKTKAKERFDYMTSKGGVVDRFTQAVAINRALQWDPEKPEANQVSFEKSQKQFREALYPMNFAADLVQEDPRKTIEPSTEAIWYVAGNNLTYLEALRACENVGNGFQLVEDRDLSRAAWLASSVLGAQMSPVAPNTKQKGIWTTGKRTEQYRLRTEEQLPSKYATRTVTVVIFSHRAYFTYHKLSENGALEPREEMVETGLESSDPNESTLAETYGNKTGKHTALCIKREGEI